MNLKRLDEAVAHFQSGHGLELRGKKVTEAKKDGERYHFNFEDGSSLSHSPKLGLTLELKPDLLK